MEVSQATMKSLEISKIFDETIVSEILETIKTIEDPRWTRRTKLEPGRAIEDSSCAYDFCNHNMMSKEQKKFFKQLAPRYEDFILAEIAINRYRKGDYIGKHRDRDYYRRNLVVALQENGDGLIINDYDNQFIEDKIGQGVLIEGVGPTHSVPPVKNERFSLVFLYE